MVSIFKQAEAEEIVTKIVHTLRKKDDGEYAKGHYECGFELEVPKWLPESMFMKIEYNNEHASMPGYVGIRYTLKVELDEMSYSTVLLFVHNNKTLH